MGRLDNLSMELAAGRVGFRRIWTRRNVGPGGILRSGEFVLAYLCMIWLGSVLILTTVRPVEVPPG